MKTDLGLNFLRVVNEEGANGWSQMFARVPFSDEELKEKGSLFGVIFSEELDDWMSKESEIMMWVDENFTESEEVDLQKIADYFDKKTERISYVWLWVGLGNGGKREVKFVKSGEGGIWMRRGENTVDLGKNLMERKVVKGQLNDGDLLLIWSGGLDKKVSEGDDWSDEKTVIGLGNLLAEENLSAAGLSFTVEGGENLELTIDNKKVEEKTPKVEEQTEEEVEGVVETIEEDFEKETENEEVEVEEVVGSLVSHEHEVVSDRYVGKVGTKEKIVNWWKSGRRGRGDLSVNREVIDKKKKIFLLVGMVFLGLLVGSVAVGTIKIKREGEQKKWEAFYEPLEKKRQEALSLKDINLIGSRKLMDEVKAEFEAGRADFQTGRYSQQVSEFEGVIVSSWEEASGEKESVVNERLDINLIREGFVGKKVSLASGKTFVVLDGMGTVVTADGDTKEILVVGKDEKGGVIDVVNDGKRNLFLYNRSVVEVKTSEVLSDFDSAVAEPVSLGVFGSSVYLLDKVNQEIYKYTNGGGVLGERSRWLKEGESMKTMGIDMAIDGDIWVLYEDGTVGKFRRGVEERFSLNGANTQGKSIKLAVAVEGEGLALLSDSGNYIMIFNKETGDFKKQLKLGSVGVATDIEFDEQGNLWALVGGSLLVLE